MSLALSSSILVLAGEENPIEHILPKDLWATPWLTITNHVFMLLVSAVVMLLIFPLVARSKDRVPKGFRNFIESILQYMREQVARPTLHEATDRFMPFLWTVFFLILLANVLGALPIDAALSAITGRATHLGGTATGNLSITAGLAICAFLVIHVGGMMEHGVFGHLKAAFVPHVHWLLWILLIPLEILGAIVKPFALAIRLFANMIAGHIVLAVILGFTKILADGFTGGGAAISATAVLGALFISLLELFVAFLQAYIFTYLTTLFVGMAVHPQH